MKIGKLWLLFMLLWLCFSLKAQNQPSVYKINAIEISGNEKTKDFIIFRELTFTIGDSISIADLELSIKKSEENLINTTLFLHASIDTFFIEGNVSLIINIAERWYLWPIPIIELEERNFSSWLDNPNLRRLSGGLFFTYSNFRGRNESLSVLAEIGYNKRIGLKYQVPYINKKKTFGLGFSSIYSSRHEVNYASIDNKQVYLKVEDKKLQSNLITTLQLLLRPNLYTTFSLDISHNYYEVADTVFSINPYYMKSHESSFFSSLLKIKNDHRDYASYPLKGYYIDLEAFVTGIATEKANDFTQISLQSTARKYFHISSRWNYAAGATAKYTLTPTPFYLTSRGLGYARDFVRGYEKYIIDGQHFIVFKNNIKFTLIQTKYFAVEEIDWNKFNSIPFTMYINAFIDAGYCKNIYNKGQESLILTKNKLENSLLMGYGFGLDMVSYYDLVLRIEASRNLENEFWFAVHFIAPI